MGIKMAFSLLKHSDIKSSVGKNNQDTLIVKIDFDFKHPVDTYQPTYFSFVPNARTHARRISQDVPRRKISTSAKPWQGPETLTISREDGGYGFSLRYFIVYPPAIPSPSPTSSEKGFNRNSYWADRGLDFTDGGSPTTMQPPPLDTFFVKTVDPGSSAEQAGLKSGDRVVSVNGDLIGGKTYKDVVELIQYSSGDLKLGVVPRNEDILQLVYEEYVTENSSVTSESTCNLRRNSSTSSMQRASANKWSVPITPKRKSDSFESNGSNANNSNRNSDLSDKKYDPCVQFISGRLVNSTSSSGQDGKSSRSNSVSSSGSGTPLNKPGKRSPSNRGSNSNFDPCVSFISGKPRVITNGSPSEGNRSSCDASDAGVQPQTLQNALRKEVQKKNYSVGTRLAPKPIAGVSKPGAVSNIAGLFARGNEDELSNSSINRKKSATLVLRDDFQMCSINSKVQGNDEKTSYDTSKRRTSQSSDKENSKLSSRNKKNNLSSTTSQATLVESQSPGKGISALVNNTILLNGVRSDNIKNKRNSPMSQRKRTLLRNGRKTSVSSSVENSEDEDVESADESGLDNWKGRRVSYLMANTKKEYSGKKNSDANMEADDEDSDTNSSKKKKSGEEVNSIIKEGPLNRKLEQSLDRKKPSQRTWKPIYAVLKGHRLFCYKEGGADADDEIIQPIPVRSTIIEIANDYVKRKHVFRMVTSHGNEYLFQAEDATRMVSWVNTLRDANPDKESLLKSTASIKQEKQEKQEGNEHATAKRKDKEEKKGLSIKRSHFSLRGSKKGRSPNAAPRPSKEVVAGKTFGILLRNCTPAKNAKNVPLIVEHCCKTIEDKGKELIGIYRIPGNASAVQALQTELDTKNPEDINWREEKWYELNNIGSLLKSFLRKTEEPVIPNDMYTKLIEANRVPNGLDRLKSIKNLVHNLPEYHNETLEFLMRHLKVIVEHSDKNKMEAKNIAIMFGPNVIRRNTVASMVRDMSDQCRIIETMLKHCDWMFSSDDSYAQPIEIDNESEVIGAGVSKGLMDCLNNQQQITMTFEPEPEASNSNSKKGGKLSTLKSNISMKLRSTKVTSPKSNKKPKNGAASQDENESDDDTSGWGSQSPPTDKNEKRFKVKETAHVTNMFTRRPSNENQTTTKIGSFSQNIELHMQFDNGSKSPQMSPQFLHSKPYNDDNDGQDSGVTSPQRLDSDDNMSVYSDSGAHSSRKESLESLSGPSPRIERRHPARQQSAGSSSNDERSPPLKKSTFLGSPGCPAVKEEDPTFDRKDVTRISSRKKEKNDNVRSPVVKRTETVRRRANFSPRASKRELYSILPGDGNNYEEKIQALLDPEYSGNMKEQARNEMGRKTIEDDLDSPVSPLSPTGLNSDWWLSGDSQTTKRMANSPKDKAAALNIISSLIDSKHRPRISSDSNITVTDNSVRRNPLLSPTVVRRVGLQSFNPELSERVDHFNQKKEEHQKKMTGIFSNLGGDFTKNNVKTGPGISDKLKTVNDLRIPLGPTFSEPRTDKLDRYLKQVSELLSESDSCEEREKITTILRKFQTAHDTIDNEPHQRVNSERSRPTKPVPQKLQRSKSGPMIRTKNARATTNRTSPLLDDTYSNLNYSRLYPR